jgi:hypothetical protein
MPRLYAAKPSRRTFQIAGDLLCLFWLLLWIWIAKFVYDLINKLAVPGDYLQRSGEGISGGVDNLPSLLRSVGGPLDSLGNGLANAGSSQISATNDIAWFFAIVTVVLPTFVPLAAHAFMRVRWVRSASAVSQMQRSQQFNHLLAQRALARQPLRKIAAAVGDRDLDPAERELALAQLELDELGLRASAS